MRSASRVSSFEIGAENAHGDVRRRPAKPFVDAHPERRGEEDGDTRDVLQSVSHGVLDLVHPAASFILQDDEHIGRGVRHRIFGRLRASRPSHDIVDLRDFTQEVFDAVIEPVDLFERGFRRQDRLQQQRAFVEPRHEVRADPRGDEQGRHGDERRDAEHHEATSQAVVEHRRVQRLDSCE